MIHPSKPIRSFMNPVFFQRLFKAGVCPIKSMGIILRRSSYYHRDFVSLTLGRRGQANIRSAVERNKRILGVSASRVFSTSVPMAQTRPGMVLFGAVTAIGMMGGIYYYSSSLKDTVIFQKAIDVMNHCPMVLELLGSPILSHSLARGKVNEKEAKVVFVVRGKNGEFLVTLIGHCIDEGIMSIYSLSLHERAKNLDDEHYIYKDGILVSKVLEDIDDEEEQSVSEFVKEEFAVEERV